jgi:hypothetical protein
MGFPKIAVVQATPSVWIWVTQVPFRPNRTAYVPLKLQKPFWVAQSIHWGTEVAVAVATET